MMPLATLDPPVKRTNDTTKRFAVPDVTLIEANVVTNVITDDLVRRTESRWMLEILDVKQEWERTQRVRYPRKVLAQGLVVRVQPYRPNFDVLRADLECILEEPD